MARFLTGLFVLCALVARSQNSISTLFKDSKIFVETYEKMNYEVVRVDFNVLTKTDNWEESKRNFSKGYVYSIAVYSDNERISKIGVKLYEARDGKWELASTGKPLEVEGSGPMNYVSNITYTPDADHTNLIRIEALTFAEGASSGRFFVVIGHRSAAVDIATTNRLDVKLLTKKNEIVTKGKRYEFKSNFSVTSDAIEHTYGGNTIYYSIANRQEVEGSYVYSLTDAAGKGYKLTINVNNGTIDMFPDGTDKSIDGMRYFMSGF